jgi:hypothetical protein
MRLIEIIQKITVTIKIQARWSTSIFVIAGNVSIRIRATR